MENSYEKWYLMFKDHSEYVHSEQVIIVYQLSQINMYLKVLTHRQIHLLGVLSSVINVWVILGGPVVKTQYFNAEGTLPMQRCGHTPGHSAVRPKIYTVNHTGENIYQTRKQVKIVL